jgi:peptide/nickel transport system substrate-binding protein
LTNVALDTSCEGTNFAGFPCDKQGVSLRDAVFAAPDDATRKAAFEAFQRAMWQFIPYVPAGLFDVQNAYTQRVFGVLDSYVIAYWNIELH